MEENWELRRLIIGIKELWRLSRGNNRDLEAKWRRIYGFGS